MFGSSNIFYIIQFIMTKFQKEKNHDFNLYEFVSLLPNTDIIGVNEFNMVDIGCVL